MAPRQILPLTDTRLEALPYRVSRSGVWLLPFSIGKYHCILRERIEAMTQILWRFVAAPPPSQVKLAKWAISETAAQTPPKKQQGHDIIQQPRSGKILSTPSQVISTWTFQTTVRLSWVIYTYLDISGDMKLRCLPKYNFILKEFLGTLNQRD